MSPREKLLEAFASWRRLGDSELNRLSWAAVADLQERLPPPGPDPVELEVASWFPETELTPRGECAGGGEALG